MEEPTQWHYIGARQAMDYLVFQLVNSGFASVDQIVSCEDRNCRIEKFDIICDIMGSLRN